MKKHHTKKLEEFTKKELNNLAHNLVVSEGNCYFLFGRYELQKLDHEVIVIKNDDTIGTFGNTKTAVAWCIADKYNKVNLAIQIKQLDQERTRYINDITVKRALAARSKDYTFKETMSVKLATQQIQYQSVDTELSKCVNLAKYWQYRGFNNETQRISSSATY